MAGHIDPTKEAFAVFGADIAKGCELGKVAAAGVLRVGHMPGVPSVKNLI